MQRSENFDDKKHISVINYLSLVAETISLPDAVCAHYAGDYLARVGGSWRLRNTDNSDAVLSTDRKDSGKAIALLKRERGKLAERDLKASASVAKTRQGARNALAGTAGMTDGLRALARRRERLAAIEIDCAERVIARRAKCAFECAAIREALQEDFDDMIVSFASRYETELEGLDGKTKVERISMIDNDMIDTSKTFEETCWQTIRSVESEAENDIKIMQYQSRAEQSRVM